MSEKLSTVFHSQAESKLIYFLSSQVASHSNSLDSTPGEYNMFCNSSLACCILSSSLVFLIVCILFLACLFNFPPSSVYPPSNGDPSNTTTTAFLSTSNMSMFSTGILVLTSPLHTLPLRIAPVLSSAAQLVERTLYVHLHPGLNLGGGSQPRPVFIPPVVDLSTLISRLYSNAADVCGHLDVRVLLTNVRAQSQTVSNGPFPSPQSLSHSPEVVLTDFPLQDPGESHQVTQCLQRYTGHCYVCSPSLPSVLLHPQLMKLQEQEEGLKEPEKKAEPLETYSDVVVGGTFDRLHGAHKTLLNISCLLANRRFLIGVCDQAMLKSK